MPELDPDADGAPVTVHCARCGTPGEALGGGAPLGWSMGTERGRVERHCPECARANIRSIEGKLSSDWWE